jgi:hypothetical protein
MILWWLLWYYRLMVQELISFIFSS